MSLKGVSSSTITTGGGGGTGTGVNAADVGNDIVLCIGQSNMVGRGTIDTLADVVDSRVMQFGGASEQARYRTIFSGASPTHNAEALQSTLSPQTHFGKVYASTIPANRSVLLVPCAYGGTTLVTPNINGFVTAPWAVGGTLYEKAVTHANLAITEAQKTHPNSRIVGMIWHQGESDGDNSVPKDTYATALTSVITGLRTRITGASNAWFVIGGLMPEAISANAGYPAIRDAHIQVAAATSKCAYVVGPSGYQADTWHYTAGGARILGSRMALAVQAAMVATGAVVPASAVTVNVNSTSGVINNSVTVTVGTNNPLTGTQTESVTLSSNVAGSFGANPLTLNSTSTTASTTFTPTAVGQATITATPTGTPVISSATTTYTAVAAPTAPSAPTIGTATAGNASASVAFTAPTNTGGASISGYTVTSTPGNFTGTGSASPITVSGLTNGTQYTFTVHATNSAGNSVESAASNGVTPAASTFATFSSTDKNSTFTLSNNNLTATNSGAAAWSSARATVGKSAGKWYWEVVYTGSNRAVIGIGTSAAGLTGGFVGADTNGWGMYTDGSLYMGGGNNNNSPTSAGFTAGDTIGMALDMDNKRLTVYKNGAEIGRCAGGSLAAGPFFPMVSSEGAGYAFTANFGATAFTNTPPAGFSGLI